MTLHDIRNDPQGIEAQGRIRRDVDGRRQSREASLRYAHPLVAPQLTHL